ncbi:MAG: 4-hydroxy-3-methylbut-2-en-1-yl diphosphate synthase [Chitinophagaceae bacterium]|nr:MAG: 4-hydroxy-3-methylbut-2-en-1-yl diphosphate synthase [Chitinophagaceae bacterium]
MQFYTESLTQYKRLQTREVKVGNLLLGAGHPIRVQTMTTTDTMDTLATVEQCIRCIDAGAEMVRITAPSKKEAENLQAIKDELHKRGYSTPLVADIHFTPNAAEIAARIIEKVRVNPGNYVDKKKFEQIEYTDAEYAEEIERIRERFTPLVLICKEHGTAMRIGTNHGSLSDRIMSRYGDTAIGMVESAMEFLRIARSEDYHNIVLSMKSSNPLVMVQAYRLLIQHMMDEFSECYPLHLGVTEAGDGEDGRIKSAIGIGTLLQDKKRITNEVANMGSKHVPVVVADFMQHEVITATDLETIGYTYNAANDKWNIADAAADIIYTGDKTISFALPGTLNILCDHSTWLTQKDNSKYYPLYQGAAFLSATEKSATANFIAVDVNADNTELMEAVKSDATVVLCVYASAKNAMQSVRNFISRLMEQHILCPVIIAVESMHPTVDEQLIHFSIGAGAVFLDGMGDGIWLMNDPSKMVDQKVSGRTYLPTKNNHQFLNNTSFSILQAVRTRISKTEYISCPSCGRTLFDLQETTAKIRNVTNHLKGLKIAIMGCIVNGPGEMADADFGYVGSGPGKITLYKGKEVVKRNINSDVAVGELINLLKENDAWIEPA